MSKEKMRTHVVIPKALVETIDELVGKRHRSEFLVLDGDPALENLRIITAQAFLQRLKDTV